MKPSLVGALSSGAKSVLRNAISCVSSVPSDPGGALRGELVAGAGRQDQPLDQPRARLAALSSPLILVPVELRCESPRHPYARYVVDDEETVVNPSLTEKLRRDLGMEDEIEQAVAGSASRSNRTRFPAAQTGTEAGVEARMASVPDPPGALPGSRCRFEPCR